MVGMTGRLNAWYDALREPWRFLAALALAAVGFALLAEGQSLLIRCAGGVWLVWLVLVRMSNSRRR